LQDAPQHQDARQHIFGTGSTINRTRLRLLSRKLRLMAGYDTVVSTGGLSDLRWQRNNVIDVIEKEPPGQRDDVGF
jgi:hypothetical protein